MQAAIECLTVTPMVDIAPIEVRRPASAAAILIGLIFAVLGLPAALFAVASGLGLLPLPYPLLLVLQRLPNAFPLHMVASGLALILIPIAAFTRRRGRLHRAAGRTAAICVVIGGVTALSVALASEASIAARTGFFVQGVVWLALLAAAVAAIRRGDRALHARLMLAMAGVATGALWLRLVMAGALVLNLPFETTYAISAWTCWLIPVVVALTARTAAASMTAVGSASPCAPVPPDCARRFAP